MKADVPRVASTENDGSAIECVRRRRRRTAPNSMTGYKTAHLRIVSGPKLSIVSKRIIGSCIF